MVSDINMHKSFFHHLNRAPVWMFTMIYRKRIVAAHLLLKEKNVSNSSLKSWWIRSICVNLMSFHRHPPQTIYQVMFTDSWAHGFHAKPTAGEWACKLPSHRAASAQRCCELRLRRDRAVACSWWFHPRCMLTYGAGVCVRVFIERKERMISQENS